MISIEEWKKLVKEDDITCKAIYCDSCPFFQRPSPSGHGIVQGKCSDIRRKLREENINPYDILGNTVKIIYDELENIEKNIKLIESL